MDDAPESSRRYRRFAMGAMAILTGSILVGIAEWLAYFTNIGSVWPAYAIGATSAIMGLALLLLNYLSSASATVVDPRNPHFEMHAQRTVLAELSQALDALRKQAAASTQTAALGTLSKPQRDSLIAQLETTIQSTLSDSFVSSLDAKYGEVVGNSTTRKEIRDLYERTTIRLQAEVAALTARASLNLVIGILTTLLAVGLLAWLVLSEKIESTDLTSVLLHFLPRLSIAVFIETFSFFFLRLYKACLEDIKYYQNELTAVESRFVALDASLSNGLPDSAIPILTELAKTDRNSVKDSASAGKKKSDGLNAKDLQGLLGKVSELANSVSG